MSLRSVPSSPKASLVVPAYNEEKRLPPSLKKIQSFLDEQQLNAEVIVVVEKSTDRTVQAAREAIGQDPRFIIQANEVQKGKGYAVKCGMLKARGEFVFFMDADLSTPLNEIKNFLKFFDEQPHAQVVIGSRGLPDSRVVKSQSGTRKSMGQSFNKIVQSFGLTSFKDTQCGFKAFRRETVEPVFSRQTIDGFAFDVEILHIADKLGFDIRDRSVEWHNDADSKVHIVRDSLKMLKDLFVVTWTHRHLTALPRHEDQKKAANF